MPILVETQDYGKKMIKNMFKKVIKIDYTLSAWFSKTSDKVIPGTAFLFINKVVFIWASMFFFILGILPIEIGIHAYVAILVIVSAAIMYGFQNKVESYVQSLNLKKSYSDQGKDQIKKDRIIGLLIFWCSFFLIFLTVILFH
jgi:hypothetical protein